MDVLAPDFSLTGRRALVTGASQGIGAALAVAFAKAGADVAVTGRDADRLADTAAAIDATGRRSSRLQLDVRDVARTRTAVGEVVDALGGLDILVNNAGTEQVIDSLEVDEALWDRIVETNLKGAFFYAQAAARQMAERGGGAIVNLGSLASGIGIPTATPYTASKTGVLGMTRALSAEWAPKGVRVNALGPGYFRTRMTEGFFQDQAWQDAMLGKIPMGRFGRLDDLTGAAVFLASDAARYLTGQILYVDGGYMASI
jgi:NAD(P)-dependent dehydrogenase (short-subunit alcohol dehydrogenase family)